MNKRIHYIDIARAIAIILIVFGHTIVHNGYLYWLYKYIYSFHVMLFFVISGFTYSQKKDVKKFMREKFKRLMIPYFIFSILFIIPYVIFGNGVMDTLNFSKQFNIENVLYEIAYGVGLNGALKQNTSLWFLPALFSAEIIYMLLNMVKFKYKDFLITFILLVISIISSQFTFVLPWGINSALTLLIFFQFGFLINKYNLIEKIIEINYQKKILISLVVLTFVLYDINTTVSCVDYRYGIYTLFLYNGVVISLFILLIAYKIKQMSVIEYIGKNTISILIFHKLSVILFQTKISFIANLLNNNNQLLSIFIGMCITIISTILAIIVGKVIQRYLPILYGKRFLCEKNFL